jgi:hypothetical protein
LIGFGVAWPECRAAFFYDLLNAGYMADKQDTDERFKDLCGYVPIVIAFCLW